MIKNSPFSFKYRLLLLLLGIYCFSAAQITRTFNTPGNYTFTVPAGVTSIKVEAWGGGSGGNNGNSRGGGGGAFAGNNSLTVTPLTTYTVTVGAGGASGSGDSGGGL